jgi:hypothetical protein
MESGWRAAFRTALPSSLTPSPRPSPRGRGERSVPADAGRFLGRGWGVRPGFRGPHGPRRPNGIGLQADARTASEGIERQAFTESSMNRQFDTPAVRAEPTIA